MPAVDDDRDVDVDDVAFLQRLRARNAVADHMVHRGADRVAIALVEQAGRNAAAGQHELARQIIQRRPSSRPAPRGDQHVEAFSSQLAGLAHAGEGFRSVQLDLPV
jgi:hypothetical protein